MIKDASMHPKAVAKAHEVLPEATSLVFSLLGEEFAADDVPMSFVKSFGYAPIDFVRLVKDELATILATPEKTGFWFLLAYEAESVSPLNSFNIMMDELLHTVTTESFNDQVYKETEEAAKTVFSNEILVRDKLILLTFIKAVSLVLHQDEFMPAIEANPLGVYQQAYFESAQAYGIMMDVLRRVIALKQQHKF
jgi:hypothetical protein